MSRMLLLADGSVTIQRVIELTFAHEDVRVVTAQDGRRAMQILESEQPDVVLADVDLGEVDGYALAAHIRRVPRLKNTPVLLLAGAFEPINQERAREVGSDGVIMKPFEPQVVVTRVKELIDQSARRAAPATKPQQQEAAAPAAATRPAPAVEPEAPAKPRPESVFTRAARVEREIEEAAPVVETLELPTRPLWEASGSTTVPFPGPAPVAPTLPPIPAAHAPAAPHAPPTQPKVTLANAFTALLAAEQSSQPAAPPSAAVSEASIEDAVRRVLVRMTDDLVRRIVLDTAERLIREEIEKIKSNPD